MKIVCACGNLIPDQTDALAHKARFVPDRRWHDLLDGLDALIEDAARGTRRPDAAAMQARQLVLGLIRHMWQCDRCGCLHLESRAHELLRFGPSRRASAMAILDG